MSGRPGTTRTSRKPDDSLAFARARRGAANSCARAPKNAYTRARGIPPRLEIDMAKSQKRSSREVRKPKAEKPPKQNASQPSLKPGGIKGLENMKNR